MLGFVLIALLVAVGLIWYLNGDSFSLNSKSRETTCESGTCGSSQPHFAAPPEVIDHSSPMTEGTGTTLRKRPATKRSW